MSHRLCLVALAALCSCRSTNPPAPKRLNILLVTLDTLRADHLGCYGYSRIETPNLDAVAGRGVLFENASAPAPLTAPSHASMMTGVYPTVHKVRNTGAFVLPPKQATLAKILQDHGWDTAAFIGSSVLKRRFGLNQGFAVYDDEMPSAGGGSAEAEPERRAGEVVDRAVAWLNTQSGRPFFLWAHLYDPHVPYDPPAPFRDRYADRPYDGEIAYTDMQAGRLFDAVARKSPPENTLIVVLSDHGESLADHGEYTHGVFLYESTLRIAFLLSGGPTPKGVRVKQQARTIDLLPTLLQMLGIDAPRGLQGVSLAPSFTGKDVAPYSYAETLFPKLNMGWAELRAMRTNRWKYIRAPRPELYDLSQDPEETTNVIAAHPAEARDLDARIDAITGGPEKVAPAAMDPRTLEQLKSLGYLGGSSTPAELTGKGADPKDRLEVLRLLHLGTNSGAPAAERIRVLRQAVAGDELNPALYNILGNLYSESGRLGDATQLYDVALRKGVRAPWLYSRLGGLYLRQGKTKQAITLFETATQLNPADYETLQNLAVAYRQVGRMDEAQQALNAIVQSGEDYAPAYNELGMVAFQKGDVAAAQGYFEKAARLDATYQLNLGRFYKMAGDNARARAAFTAFLTARSASPEYRNVIPQVRKELESVQ